MTDKYIFKLMEKDDCKRIADFHQVVGSNPKLNSTAFHYEYFENPDLEGFLSFLEGEDQSIIATQAFVSQNLRRGDVIFTTVMSERTLLDPHYRGKGLFKEVYDKSVELLEKKNVEFIWGRTTAVKAFRSCGFQDIDCFFDIVKVFRVGAVIKALSGKNRTIKQRAFYSYAFFISFLKFLAYFIFSIGLFRKSRLKVEYGDGEVVQLILKKMTKKHRTMFFLDYSNEKTDWLIFKNEFCKKIILQFVIQEKSEGFAIISLERDGFARLEELMICDETLYRECFLKLERYLFSIGVTGLRFSANKSNAILSDISFKMLKTGYSRLPSRIVFVWRKLDKAHPYEIKDLYITGMWAPFV